MSRAMVEAVDIEFPTASTPDGGFQRYAVANFPGEPLRRANAYDCALAVLQEVLPFFIGNDQLGENLALIFRIDDELRKEILFVLVDAAEPVIVGNHFDAGNAQHLVAIRERNRVDDGGAVDDEQIGRASWRERGWWR